MTGNYPRVPPAVTSTSQHDSPLTAHHCLQSENNRDRAKDKIWFPSKKWALRGQSLLSTAHCPQHSQHRGQGWAFNVSVQWEKTPQPHVNQEMPIDEARRDGKVKTHSDGVCEDVERREPCGQRPCLTWTTRLYTLHLVALPRHKSHYPKCPAVDSNSYGLPVCENQCNHSATWFGNIHIWWRRATFQSSSSAPSCVSWRIPHTCALGHFFLTSMWIVSMFPRTKNWNQLANSL